MRRFLMLVFVLPMLTLVGCSGARIDTTNQETTKASMKAMTDGMSKDEQTKFMFDCATVIAPETMKAMAARSGDTTAPLNRTDAEKYKSLNGMTVAEIHAKAEAMRDETKARNSKK